MAFIPPFLRPSPLGLRPIPFRISLNRRIVVESIKSTSLNVRPNVRLSDKSYFCNFTYVVLVFRKNQFTTLGETLGEYLSYLLF